MVRLEKLLQLFDCDTEEEWTDCLLRIAVDNGFQYALYGAIPSKAVPFESAFIKSNYAPEWRQTYDDGRFHYIDPVVAHCLSSSMPMLWAADAFHGKLRQEFYEQASGHGLRSGITYPIHGALGEFGMLSFVAPDHEHIADGGKFEAMKALALIRDYVFESSIRFVQNNADFTEQTRLTPRELECLKWVMVGKSSWEISMILNCSEATINFHVANLKRKFNVQTRQQAVIKAIKERLIVPA